MRTGTVAAVSDQPTATDAVAFPELDDEQLAIVIAARRSGARSRAGEVLFSPADDHYDWIVILSGSVEVLGPNGAADHPPRRSPLPRRGQPGHPPAPVPVDPGRRVGRGRRRAGRRVPGAGADRPAAQRHRARGVPRPPGRAAVDRRRHAADHRVASTRRRRWRCASTPPATGCPTTGSTPTPNADIATLLDGLGVTAADLPIAITQRGLLKRATPGELAYQLGHDRRRAARALLRRRRRRRRTGRAGGLGVRRVGGPDAR